MCCLPTFVFQEIAHPRPAGQHELSHILDDLGLILWREGGKPLCKTLESRNVVSKTELLQASASEAARSQSRSRVGDDEPLCPGGRAESGSWRGSAHVGRAGSIRPYWIAIVKVWGGGRRGESRKKRWWCSGGVEGKAFRGSRGLFSPANTTPSHSQERITLYEDNKLLFNFGLGFR